MGKPVRVLLVTGSGVSALDFDRLLDDLHRTGVTGGDTGSHGHQVPLRDQDGGEIPWGGDEDLARARDFINRQHAAGEPWFCYVNLRVPSLTMERRRSTSPAQRTRTDRARVGGMAVKPDRSR